ncbi:MAG: hypothetical protein LBM18_05590 [Oscillospiraceae bacterium]|jgi:hypothetical protein|nr:hypothetical protein [Oscillospiraceae bacterium]
MKKTLSILLVLILAFSMLAGCGGGKSDSLDVRVTNSSGYTFEQLYVTPTAQNDFGDDLFGSTTILKDGGSFDIKVMKYEFDTYDVRIVDEDDDVYQFSRVSLGDGSEIAISWDNGLVATVTAKDGSSAEFEGVMNPDSEDSGSVADSGGDDGGEQTDSGDGIDYNPMYFTVYNETDYEIHFINITPENIDAPETDILAEKGVLAAGESYVVDANLAGTEYEGTTAWYMYIQDSVGDTSIESQWFTTYDLDYVDIYWDGDAQGYYCEFNYR